jgi:ribosomal protein L11 methyltransferase
VRQSWLQLTIRAGKRDLEILSNYAIEQGSPGVVLKTGSVNAFFPSSRRDAALKSELQRFVSERARKVRLEWSIVKSEDWEHSWKRFIKPARVGRSFWVTPPWLQAPKFRRRRIITIEPGMAFGTGTHATTRGCMEFLEIVAAKLAGKSWSVLDVGTGSGILAIASRILGATTIWAIDNDPVAVEVARENLRSNAMAGAVVLSGQNLGSIRRRFTVLVANLTAETILEVADELEKRVAPGGYMVLSGILRPQTGTVVHRFGKNFRVLERRGRREWVSVLFQQSGSSAKRWPTY